MPVLMIWRPDDRNTYGHVALQTKKYHMSFWPDGNIKDFGALEASLVGVRASLILHHQRDKYLEDNRNPIQHFITKVTDEDLDRVFEEFLRFNGIEPESVAEVKARVSRLIEEKQTAQLANMIKFGKEVDLVLSRTLYSFLPTLMVKKMNDRNPSGFWTRFRRSDRNLSFAERAQSCTSFCYHLIELADKSKDTMTPIPENPYTVLRELSSILTLDPSPSKPVLDVPTFEKLAKSYYVYESLRISKNILELEIAQIPYYLRSTGGLHINTARKDLLKFNI